MEPPDRSRRQPRVPESVVVLAGGFGTRLAEHTDALPKPMIEIGGRPILWHILKLYGHYGFGDFFIACGYRGNVIKRFFLEERQQASDIVIDYRADHVERLSNWNEPWRVALIDTGLETATGGRLRRLSSALPPGPFMMTYGDGVADIDIPALIDFHRGHDRLVTFTAVRAPARFGYPVFDGDRVTAFSEKGEDDASWINGGFFVIEPEALALIDGDGTSFESDTMPALAAAGQLMAYRHHGFWQPMDTLRDLRTLNRLCEGRAAPWMVWAS